MPSLVFVQGDRAMCREHGDVGPAADWHDHVVEAHPWIDNPDPD